MLVEMTPVPAGVWPVDTLAQHLRLSRGFADDGVLDERLRDCLRAGAAAIEARTAKVLFRRQFSMTQTRWSASDRCVLPVAPVLSVQAFTLISRTGSEAELDADSYALERDDHVPSVIALSGHLPVLAPGASAVITFTAGFADDWDGLPADLRQAVLLLAAEFFGQNVVADRGLPRSIAALIDPYRTLRLRGAGA